MRFQSISLKLLSFTTDSRIKNDLKICESVANFHRLAIEPSRLLTLRL